MKRDREGESWGIIDKEDFTFFIVICQVLQTSAFALFYIASKLVVWEISWEFRISDKLKMPIVPHYQILEFPESMWLTGLSLPLLDCRLEYLGKQGQTLLHLSKFCTSVWPPLYIPKWMFELTQTLWRNHLCLAKRKLNLHVFHRRICHIHAGYISGQTWHTNICISLIQNETNGDSHVLLHNLISSIMIHDHNYCCPCSLECTYVGLECRET